MQELLKRLIVGTLNSAEQRKCLIALTLLLFFGLWTQMLAQALALMLAALLSPVRVLLPLTVLLSLPYFHLGLEAVLFAAFSLAMTATFRSLYLDQKKLAANRQSLLKTLVHELRNPLFAAKGTIDNLSANSQQIKQEDLEVQLAMASEAMQVINQEVDDLTQLLRLESGRLIARPNESTLQNVYRSIRRRYPPQSTPDHTLEFHGEELRGHFDPLLLVQALDKLITNAVTHAPDGRVAVTGFHRENRLIVEVSDEGPGIPWEARHEIFDRFKQLGTDSIGFGLGLYLARQYIEAQNGKLELQNTNSGCCFRISLPLDF